MINEDKRLGHQNAEPGKRPASPESEAEQVMLAVLQSIAQTTRGAGEGTGSAKAK